MAIHALDRPFADILRRNAARQAMAPEAVIDCMIGKYEPPSVLEALEVSRV